MPTVNIYFQTEEYFTALQPALASMRLSIAEELSVPEFPVKASEVSIRLIQVRGGAMIAPLELDIVGHRFPKRIERQDAICARIRAIVMQLIVPPDAKVWLELPDLGHSMKPEKTWTL